MMKKWNKTVLLSVVLIAGSLHNNLYAGFFESFTNNLQNSLQQATAGQKTAAQKQPVEKKVELPKGVTKKGSNVRSGPGTTNAKVAHLPKGTEMTILETQGNWLQINAQLNGKPVNGWIYKPLVNLSGTQGTVETNTIGTENRQNVFYAGYSKEFQTVKKQMAAGDLKGVEKFFTEREAAVLKKNQSKWDAINEIGLLRWMERGTLYLDQGYIDKSIKAFTNAEDILNVRQQDSKASDFLKSVVSFAAETATGNEEFQEYPGEGFEKVLMLNYKSIAFLLAGDRKAYNVSRRAIDWQNMEKVRFQEEIEEARKELKEKKSTEQQDTTAGDEWQQSYSKLDKIATRVPSAFVNPFGYYVTAMIQEIDSKDNPSLKDNARIAYKKALELNPKSKVIKQAYNDLKNKKRYGNKRLLHIVVGDGFAPEKKMLVYNFSAADTVVPIKLPIYEPVATKVARIDVQTSSGKRLARLSPVADIEALSLRHQKDTEAFRSLRMVLATARAVGVNQASKGLGIFGNLVSSTVNDLAAPDMRSWMSLPATLQAARLHLSKNIKTIKLVSYDAKGRRLATQKVKLKGSSDAFVYARSINKQMYVHGSKPLWTVK